MEPLSFRITGRQLRSLRRAVLLICALASVLAVATGVSGSWVGSNPGLTLGVGGAALGALYALVVHARAYTECTPAGIRTRGLAGTRECGWEDVADIVAQPYRGAAFIIVVTRSGRRFRLGAPMEGGVMGDPQLPAKMAKIRQYWQSAVAAAAGSAPT